MSCYPKQLWIRGGGKSGIHLTEVSVFAGMTGKNRHFRDLSQQVLSGVVAAAANCSFDDNLTTCLREKSAEEIISLQSNIPTKALMELSNPVIDGDFIVGSPQKLYQKKKDFNNVQIMAGFTTHESSLDVFLRLGNAGQVSKEEFKNVTGTLLEGLTQNKIVEQLVQYQYADDSDTTARDRMIDFQSDFMTVAPMLFEAKALKKVIYKKNTHTHKTCYEHGGYNYLSKRPLTGGSAGKWSFFVVVFSLPEYKRVGGSLK